MVVLIVFAVLCAVAGLAVFVVWLAWGSRPEPVYEYNLQPTTKIWKKRRWSRDGDIFTEYQIRCDVCGYQGALFHQDWITSSWLKASRDPNLFQEAERHQCPSLDELSQPKRWSGM